MVTYISAPIGKKFVMTELGFEQPQVRLKYEAKSPVKIKYEKSAPKTWVEAGYVVLMESAK